MKAKSIGSLISAKPQTQDEEARMIEAHDAFLKKIGRLETKPKSLEEQIAMEYNYVRMVELELSSVGHDIAKLTVIPDSASSVAQSRPVGVVTESELASYRARYAALMKSGEGES